MKINIMYFATRDEVYSKMILYDDTLWLHSAIFANISEK